MMISEDLLLLWGATYKEYEAGESVFEEGGTCHYYNQLVKGRVKWMNINDEGKEYIQEIIMPGQCFGEIPLFDEGPYVSSSVALEHSLVIRLPKSSFLEMIKESPALHMSFTSLIAKRLRYKFMILKTNAFENPEKRITFLLEYLKKEKHIPVEKPFHVDLTRQQIANITGLRVETVIRAIRQLNDNHELKIDQGKIIF